METTMEISKELETLKGQVTDLISNFGSYERVRLCIANWFSAFAGSDSFNDYSTDGKMDKAFEYFLLNEFIVKLEKSVPDKFNNDGVI